jgi:CRISPR-associated endonuclease/helicase Cas3
MSITAAFWGKARPNSDDGPRSHPLLAHCLDVAAVAILLPGGIPSVDPRMLGFLVSVHDIGKFSHPFQAKEPAAWPIDILGRWCMNTTGIS